MSNAISLLVFLLGLLTMGVSPSHGADANAASSLLWSASMEQGNLEEWSLDDCGGEFNSGTADAVATRDHAHSGLWGARLTISTPSSSQSGTRLFRWCEPQQHPALYYRAWFYFPQQYTAPNWWNVFQWKSKISATKNDPFFILNVGNREDGTMYFYLYDWQQRVSHSQTTAQITVGRWTQIEAFYQCAADATGKVMIWQDGQLLFDVSRVKTRYANGDCEWSVNNYSDALSPANATIYVDEAAISLTRSDGPIPSPGAPSRLQLRVSEAEDTIPLE